MTSILAILFTPFGFMAPKTLFYLAFSSFDYECTLWRLFQKCVVHTKFEMNALCCLAEWYHYPKSSWWNYMRIMKLQPTQQRVKRRSIKHPILIRLVLYSIITYFAVQSLLLSTQHISWIRLLDIVVSQMLLSFHELKICRHIINNWTN